MIFSSGVRLGSERAFRAEAGTEQGEPRDAPVRGGVGVDLLFDDEPAVAETPGPDPHPPAQLQPWPDLADDRLYDFEVDGVAEPPVEGRADLVRPGPVLEAAGYQGGQLGVLVQSGREPGEVPLGQTLEKGPGGGEPGNGFRGHDDRSTAPRRPANRATTRYSAGP